MGIFDFLNPGGAGPQQPGAPADPNYFQRLNNILQAQRAGPGAVSGILSPQPNLGQPNPGQYGPPAPGSQNNPLQPPGFDLGQPNPGQYGPPAPGSQNNPTQPSLWQNLMGALGQMRPMGGGGAPSMPGTTIGAPAGASPAMPPQASPMMPQGQMPPPSGSAVMPPPAMPLGSYFRALQQPAQPGQMGGNPGLMQQYMMLQQLMQR